MRETIHGQDMVGTSIIRPKGKQEMIVIAYNIETELYLLQEFGERNGTKFETLTFVDLEELNGVIAMYEAYPGTHQI